MIRHAFFYKDGFLIEGCAGFVVHGLGEFGHKIQVSAGVFTAELSTLFTVLRHIVEVIRPPEGCLILTDSQLVYECKQLC
jgi:hypothetical protein